MHVMVISFELVIEHVDVQGHSLSSMVLKVLSFVIGNAKVMEAKWLSLVNHMVDIHSGHKDPLFPECLHGDLPEDTLWITPSKLVST